MAKYEHGILGGFSGKVGKVTGYRGVSDSIIRASGNAKKINVQGKREKSYAKVTQSLRKVLGKVYLKLCLSYA